jgi:hypothetical protein
MEYGKYIIVEELGHEVAIMFNSLITHADFTELYHSKYIKAAGFFVVDTEYDEIERKSAITVSVWGKSVTLKLESRKEDVKLIKDVIDPF